MQYELYIYIFEIMANDKLRFLAKGSVFVYNQLINGYIGHGRIKIPDSTDGAVV